MFYLFGGYYEPFKVSLLIGEWSCTSWFIGAHNRPVTGGPKKSTSVLGWDRAFFMAEPSAPTNIHEIHWNRDGSKPTKSDLGWMNIHLPAILMFTRVPVFWAPNQLEAKTCFSRTAFSQQSLGYDLWRRCPPAWLSELGDHIRKSSLICLKGTWWYLVMISGYIPDKKTQ